MAGMCAKFKFFVACASLGKAPISALLLSQNNYGMSESSQGERVESESDQEGETSACPAAVKASVTQGAAAANVR